MVQPELECLQGLSIHRISSSASSPSLWRTFSLISKSMKFIYASCILFVAKKKQKKTPWTFIPNMILLQVLSVDMMTLDLPIGKPYACTYINFVTWTELSISNFSYWLTQKRKPWSQRIIGFLRTFFKLTGSFCVCKYIHVQKIMTRTGKWTSLAKINVESGWKEAKYRKDKG